MCLLLTGSTVGAASISPTAPVVSESAGAGSAANSTHVGATGAVWSWPVPQPRRLVRAFEAPPHQYGAGHRGLDIQPFDSQQVTAPDAGVIAFAGRVVDRDLLTIDHGAGLVSTLEPVTPAVAVGDVVARGDVVGTLSRGGHTPAGQLHLGARRSGAYIDPLPLLGGVPRAILLPCC